MKTTIRLLLVISATMCIGGCWNRREANLIDYAMAVGIDLNERNEIALTVQTPVLEAVKPQSPNGGKDQSKSLSVAGKTTFEAVRNYTDIMGIKIYWAHLKVIAISEEAARKGVDRYIDFFLADHEMRNTAYIVVVKGRAKDLLEAAPDITSISANLLHNQLENAGINAVATPIRFNEFARKLAYHEGAQPYVPLVRMFEQRDYDRKIVGIEPYKGGEVKQSVLFRVEGTAVFRESHMVGMLNGQQTRGLLWVGNKVENAVVRVPCISQGDDCYVTLEVSGKPKTSVKVDYDGGLPDISVRIKANINIAERASSTSKLDENAIQQLERQFADVVRSDITAAFDKAAKDLHSDVFEFGIRLEDAHWRKWEKIADVWDRELLPHARIRIDVDAKIRRRGRMLYSPWVRDDKS